MVYQGRRGHSPFELISKVAYDVVGEVFASEAGICHTGKNSVHSPSHTHYSHIHRGTAKSEYQHITETNAKQ